MSGAWEDWSEMHKWFYRNALILGLTCLLVQSNFCGYDLRLTVPDF